MQDYTKLNVWKKAHKLTAEIYRATSAFPKDELYGLTSQIRRASVSVPSNIVEGCGREGDAELAHFLQIAFASSNELEYQILLANELEFIDSGKTRQLREQISEVKRMLTSLIQKVRNQKSL